MRRGWFLLTVPFVVLIALAGCSSGEDTGPKGDGNTHITEVRLSDGTKCAVMDSINGKAISCAW